MDLVQQKGHLRTASGALSRNPGGCRSRYGQRHAKHGTGELALAHYRHNLQSVLAPQHSRTDLGGLVAVTQQRGGGGLRREMVLTTHAGLLSPGLTWLTAARSMRSQTGYSYTNFDLRVPSWRGNLLLALDPPTSRVNSWVQCIV